MALPDATSEFALRVSAQLAQARNNHERLELLSASDDYGVALIDDETLALIQDMALIAGDDNLLYIVEQEMRLRDAYIAKRELDL